MANDVSTKKLILIPAIITLAVTALRLVGELMHWSPRLFSRAAGGGGSLVGITWLVLVFGIYFGWRLARAGHGPSGLGPAFGWSILGSALVPALGFGAIKGLGLDPQGFGTFGVFVVAGIAGAILAYRGWPALGRVLFAYGLAARIPVIVVMLVAMLGNWGTHYDVAPPGFPEMGLIAKWLLIGVVPQLTIWQWFTIAVGGVFGAVGAAVAGGARRTVTA